MTAAVALARGPRPCVSEVRRLRAALDTARRDRDRLAAMIAAHLAADPADAHAALWRAYARESYRLGRDDMAAEIAAAWPAWPPLPAPDAPALDALERQRWTVRGEPRTRETFSAPHPGDSTGTEPR